MLLVGTTCHLTDLDHSYDYVDDAFVTPIAVGFHASLEVVAPYPAGLTLHDLPSGIGG